MPYSCITLSVVFICLLKVVFDGFCIYGLWIYASSEEAHCNFSFKICYDSYKHTFRVAHRQTNVKSCGHPAQDGWVKILWPVGGAHHHHLRGSQFRFTDQYLTFSGYRLVGFGVYHFYIIDVMVLRFNTLLQFQKYLVIVLFKFNTFFIGIGKHVSQRTAGSYGKC